MLRFQPKSAPRPHLFTRLHPQENRLFRLTAGVRPQQAPADNTQDCSQMVFPWLCLGKPNCCNCVIKLSLYPRKWARATGCLFLWLSQIIKFKGKADTDIRPANATAIVFFNIIFFLLTLLFCLRFRQNQPYFSIISNHFTAVFWFSVVCLCSFSITSTLRLFSPFFNLKSPFFGYILSGVF